VPKVCLQRPRVVTPVRKLVPAGVPEHVRVRLDRKFGPGGGSINQAREASGGEWGAALRCEHEGRLRLLLTMRRARNSSPTIGCVLGVPCLTLGTCRAAVRKSICSQRRSTSSDTRRPCLLATRTMVASRWPWRLRLTALISLSTSASVRCSRVRRSALNASGPALERLFIAYRSRSKPLAGSGSFVFVQ
jgi:hypothetical protein